MPTRKKISLILAWVTLMAISRLSIASPEEARSEPFPTENDLTETVSNKSEAKQKRDLERNMTRANIRLGFGIGLTAIGSAAILGGIGTIIVAAADSARHDQENYPTMGPYIAYFCGGVVAGIGLIPLVIGIPLWVTAYKKKKELNSKMAALPNFSFSTGGFFNARLMSATWTF